MADEPNTCDQRSMPLFIWGMIFGSGIGTALGAAFDNVAIGVAMGPGIGMTIGFLIQAAQEKRKYKPTEGDSDASE
jgi:hypothetical protein